MLSSSNASDFVPRIIAFCCDNSSYLSIEQAGQQGLCYPDSIAVIRMPCTGKVDELHILKAFEEGADGVLVLGCYDECCQFLDGSRRVQKRINHLHLLLAEIGISKDRLGYCSVAANTPVLFVRIAEEFTTKIKELGPVFREAAKR